MPMNRRWLHLLLLLALVVAGCGRSTGAQQPKKKVVTFWQPFNMPVDQAMAEVVAEFERLHPDIDVEMTYAANNLTGSQKLFLAIAGGVAPDVTLVDGQQLAEWAARGALTDITDFVDKSGMKADDFWLPRWQESTFNGRIYALPWGADPNFAMLWNKAAFREAGLDPEKPPRTIAELDECCRKLTKTDSRGRLMQVGIIPWEWIGDNSMFTWGYAFGGDFYTLPAEGSLVGKVTANHPKNVEALRWMASHARMYDVEKMAAFRASFAGPANNPFFLGNAAIRLFHVTEIPYLHRYAPTLDYGIGMIPAPPDGEYPNGWIGGWSMAIPRGGKASEEAFTFIRWMCTSDAGTNKLGQAMMQFPAYKKSPFFEEAKKDRDLKVFYEILQNARHVRTLMPVQGYLMDQLRRGVDNVLYDGADPQNILDQITRRTQERLEQVMQRVEQDMEREGRR